MKLKVFGLVLVLLCVFTMSSFAAPASVSVGDYGSTGYITVTNPNKNYSTTYTKTITVSGYAMADSTVYVYMMDGGVYKPCYQNGTNLSVSVGASGLFAIPVNLSSGRNQFLLRAESNGQYQNTTFEVNLLSSSMFNLIGRLQSLTLGWK